MNKKMNDISNELYWRKKWVNSKEKKTQRNIVKFYFSVKMFPKESQYLIV